jgi:hypothetical protein
MYVQVSTICGTVSREQRRESILNDSASTRSGPTRRGGFRVEIADLRANEAERSREQCR